MKSAPLTSRLLARKGAAAPSRLGDAPLARDVDHRDDLSDIADHLALLPAIEDSDALLRLAPPRPAVAELSAPDLDRLATDAVPSTRSNTKQRSPRAVEIAAEAELKRDRTGRVRLSVRLDPQRHFKLRLIAAHRRLHIQDALTDAIDAYVSHAVDDGAAKSCACLHPKADDATSATDGRRIRPLARSKRN